MFQTNRPEAQYRLRCSLSGNQHKLASTARHGSGVKEISPTSSTLASANKQLENLSKKVCLQNLSLQIMTADIFPPIHYRHPVNNIFIMI